MVAHKEPRFLSGGFMVCSADLIQHSSELSNVAHPLSDWPKVLLHSQLLLLFLFFYFFEVPTSSIRCSEKYIHNTARTDLRNENFSAAEFTHL
jgi:hypothetical protein